ncbi:serine hydrolase domain-containing protein [Nostoc sp. LEGE 06077]|uniref:serine hydrolase domain-containing protein n=1 Tax=Nostoc sp. LEGE 06077 TaxID=915325 RepID=UPI00187FD310|nr:serine hydrolase domain-containing protein [Nostoc sp. LEGE 06077]
MKDLRKQLLEILNAQVQNRGIAGVAVALNPSTQPESVWYDSATVDEPIFLAYSITKTFSAAMLLLLQEDGQLSLEDSLARWFPEIAQADCISLRQLLNHTAGIPDYGSLQAYHDSVRSYPSTPWTFEQFAAVTFEQGLCFTPGTSWAYSNPGYMLLKRIAEVVSGISYRELIFKYIIQPLGLSQTFVPESIEELSSLAPATSRALAVDKTTRDVRQYYHPGWVSHGVIASTPSEIVMFLNSLFSNRLLSPQSLKQMVELVPIAPQTSTNISTQQPTLPWLKPSYGLGLMGDPASKWGLVLGHNGGGPGYSASAFHAPELGGISICAMCAIEEGIKAEEIVFTVLDLFKSTKEIAVHDLQI